MNTPSRTCEMHLKPSAGRQQNRIKDNTFAEWNKVEKIPDFLAANPASIRLFVNPRPEFRSNVSRTIQRLDSGKKSTNDPDLLSECRGWASQWLRHRKPVGTAASLSTSQRACEDLKGLESKALTPEGIFLLNKLLLDHNLKGKVYCWKLFDRYSSSLFPSGPFFAPSPRSQFMPSWAISSTFTGFKEARSRQRLLRLD